MQSREPTDRSQRPENPIGVRESVFLLAFMMALVALSIDAILPALPAIAEDFNLGDHSKNSQQLPVTFLFIGLAAGQLIFGPLSDVIGRKKSVYLGLAVFLFGSLVSIYAASFSVLLIGRVIQGLGVASPRVNAVSIIRDLYKGAAMARIMSWILTIFIIVPMIAPGLGEAILWVSDWRGIFWMTLFCAAGMFLWFGTRQHETLKPEYQRPLRIKTMVAGFIETITHPVSVSYLLCAGFVTGGFLGFLNSSEQLFRELYSIDKEFAFCFAWVAMFVAIASILNGSLVKYVSVTKLIRFAGFGLTISAGVMLVTCFFFAGVPPFAVSMSYFTVTFFCAGILFSNLNALAMEPLGHIAGIGSAVIGSISTLLSAAIGYAIGNAFNQTLFPLVGATFVLNFAAIPLMLFAERSRKSLMND